MPEVPGAIDVCCARNMACGVRMNPILLSGGAVAVLAFAANRIRSFSALVAKSQGGILADTGRIP